jgi:hypothetical protein
MLFCCLYGNGYVVYIVMVMLFCCLYSNVYVVLLFIE